MFLTHSLRYLLTCLLTHSLKLSGLIECQQIPYAMSLLNRYLQVIEFNEGNKGKVSVFSKNLVSNIMGKIDSTVRDSVKKEVTDTFNKLQYQHVNDVIANL